MRLFTAPVGAAALLAGAGWLAAGAGPVASSELFHALNGGPLALAVTPPATVVFELNPCEYKIVVDNEAEPTRIRAVDGRRVPDADRAAMLAKFDAARGLWNAIRHSGITIASGAFSQPEPTPQQCAAGLLYPYWAADGVLRVTRSYGSGGYDGDIVTSFGLGFPVFSEPARFDECDVAFHATHWDPLDPHSDGWTVALAHELGHCIGFNHSFLGFETIDAVLGAPDTGLPSAMSYDRRASEFLGGSQGFLNRTDEALMMRTYPDPSDPPPAGLTIEGVVKRCAPGALDEVYGAMVFAVDVSGGPEGGKAVHHRISGFENTIPRRTGTVPEGEFSLDHLDAASRYDVVVLGKNDPDLQAMALDFDGEPYPDGTRAWMYLFDPAGWAPGERPFAYWGDAWDLFDSGFTGRAIVRGVTGSGTVRLGTLCEGIAREFNAGPSLAVTGACPGTLTVVITGATPGGLVALLGARSPGETPAPPPCPDLVLGLAAPRPLDLFTADADGRVRIVGPAPPGSCRLYVQAADRETCTASGVVQAP